MSVCGCGGGCRVKRELLDVSTYIFLLLWRRRGAQRIDGEHMRPCFNKRVKMWLSSGVIKFGGSVDPGTRCIRANDGVQVLMPHTMFFRPMTSVFMSSLQSFTLAIVLLCGERFWALCSFFSGFSATILGMCFFKLLNLFTKFSNIRRSRPRS